MTTTKTRSRAADKTGQQPEAQQQAEKLAELEQHIEEVKGQQPAEPKAGQDQQPEDQPEVPAQPEPQPEPEPEPAAPTATLDLGRYPFYMHKPKVTGPDGVVHECPHRDGHTKVDGGASSAMACARKVARENGLEVGEPE